MGLDSDMSRLPSSVAGDQFAFNKAIIDATHDLVCAYKPNSAFYEAAGTSGIEALKKTCDYLRSTYPEICIILDAKRADIGSTNNGYAQFIYDYLGADGVTLHPYLGREALQPFLDREDKACIILCRTSNPGAGEYQDMTVDGEPLYLQVAKHVADRWNVKGNCMLVVGATYPEELARVRQVAGDMTFLVPGIGAQGGDVEKTVKAGLNTHDAGMIVNSSRGIIFVSAGEDFAGAARDACLYLVDQINAHRKHG